MTTGQIFYAVTGQRPPRRSPRRRRGPARNWKYRAWIRTLPCTVCGREGAGVEAAHTGSDGGTSLKASDYSCIPLCVEHHTSGANCYHAGRETFERVHGIDCRQIVRTLNRLWFKYSEEIK